MKCGKLGCGLDLVDGKCHTHGDDVGEDIVNTLGEGRTGTESFLGAGGADEEGNSGGGEQSRVDGSDSLIDYELTSEVYRLGEEVGRLTDELFETRDGAERLKAAIDDERAGWQELITRYRTTVKSLHNKHIAVLKAGKGAHLVSEMEKMLVEVEQMRLKIAGLEAKVGGYDALVVANDESSLVRVDLELEVAELKKKLGDSEIARGVAESAKKVAEKASRVAERRIDVLLQRGFLARVRNVNVEEVSVDVGVAS